MACAAVTPGKFRLTATYIAVSHGRFGFHVTGRRERALALPLAVRPACPPAARGIWREGLVVPCFLPHSLSGGLGVGSPHQVS